MNHTKIGVAYSQAARPALQRAYPKMPAYSVTELLVNGSFENVEAYISIEGTLRAVVAQLRVTLKNLDIAVPTDLALIVLHGKLNEPGVGKLKAAVEAADLTELEKGAIAYELLDAAHRHRVREFSHDFFRGTRVKKRWKFLPSELIGFDTLYDDYIFVKPVLKLAGITPDQTEIKKSYQRAQKFFCGVNGIKDRHALGAYIKSGSYGALQPAVATVFQGGRAANGILVDAVVEKNPSLFTTVQ